MNRCQNCGLETGGKYCPDCGQKVPADRLTLAFFWQELFHFFTHIRSGFLFTTWSLLRTPGRMVTSYIAGKRKIHQSPVSYFLIWTSIFILTLYLFINIFGDQAVIAYKDYFGPGATTAAAISNLSFMLAFIIPVQALYLYLIITRKAYNYAETLVMAVYAVGTIIFLQFVFALYALLEFALTSRPADLRYSDILKGGYFIWFTIRLLQTRDVPLKWLRGMLFVLLAAATFTAWRLVGVPWVIQIVFGE